jgi:hypothetical protein
VIRFADLALLFLQSPSLKGAITMCDVFKKPVETGHLDRRGFLKMQSAATAAVLLMVNPCGSVARADALTREQRDKLTPEEILTEIPLLTPPPLITPSSLPAASSCMLGSTCE